jgi:hypothetical protein
MIHSNERIPFRSHLLAMGTTVSVEMNEKMARLTNNGINVSFLQLEGKWMSEEEKREKSEHCGFERISGRPKGVGLKFECPGSDGEGGGMLVLVVRESDELVLDEGRVEIGTHEMTD